MIFNSLHQSWKKFLKEELSKKYIKDLDSFLIKEKKKKEIYPDFKEVFSAFDKTTFNNLKVVILGQDPYHGEGQAHGMSFSVKKGVKIPPSLVNIYKELKSDIGCELPNHGNLQKWAQQGVLLLNTVLTVEKSIAGSHRKKGWESFTDKIIQVISERKENIVFILWGAPAFKKSKLIDTNKHLILNAPHPSPLSSYRGFFGSSPFSKTNKYLSKNGLVEIDWDLS